ncbi:MAG: hypothetical protein RI904_2020, partial [Pseudomonadota bacterium]
MVTGNGQQTSIESSGLGHTAKNGCMPLTGAQQNVWIHQQFDLKALAYNCTVLVHLEGVPDLATLNRAINQLVRESEGLRVRIAQAEGSPLQQLLPDAHYDCSLVDLRGASNPSQAHKDILNSIQNQPFSLNGGDLHRFSLIRTTEASSTLVWCLHHIVIDGTSASTFINRLAEIYRGDGVVVGKPSLSWSEAVAADLTYRAGPGFERDRAYWEECLNDLPAARTLSSRGSVKSIGLSIPEFVSLYLLREDYRSIVSWSTQTGQSAYAGFAAAVAIYLAKTLGQADQCLGVPMSGRQRDSRQTIGMLTNAIALRVDADPLKSVADVLRDVSRQSRRAMRHQLFPIHEIVKARRSHGLGEPFSFLVNLESFDQVLNFGDMVGRADRLNSGPVADLELFVFDRQDGGPVELRLAYNPELYVKDEVLSHLRRIQHLIKVLPHCGDISIGQVGLIDDGERLVLLGASQGSKGQAPQPGLTVPGLLERQVKLSPDSVAMIFEEDGSPQSMTYAEVDHKSNQLARYLIDQQIGSDDVVAIMLERSPMVVLSMLAALKAGAAYLPLDPAYPAARLGFMVKDSAAKLMITTSDAHASLEVELETHLPPLFDILSFDKQLIIDQYSGEAVTDEDRLESLFDSHLAYVIYTSGSTGLPKGVAVMHSGVINMIQAKVDRLQIDSASRMLQFASQAFDASASEIYPALATGAVLVLPDATMRGDSATHLMSTMSTHQITHATLPPALVAVLQEGTLSTLKTLVVAGEACPPILVEQYAGQVRMINAYGPTENTVCAAMSQPLDPILDGALNKGAVPIGKTIGNVQGFVLDANLDFVPVGTEGELYISGQSLARGYLNRPGLTAERFIACPFTAELQGSASRMYRTGDLVKRRPDGAIEFIGRIDDQVKLRGFRIELGEIESALFKSAPNLVQVAVLLQTLAGDKRLVAYLVPSEGTEVPSVSELRAALAGMLPDYMVPSYFVTLDRLPLTPNGKLDKTSLPDPLSQRSRDAEHATPSNQYEALICQIFSELTGVENVGPEDNFFEIGGHSLLAITLITELRDKFSLDLELEKIFEDSTPRGLAAHVRLLTPADTDPGQLTVGQTSLQAGLGRISETTRSLSYGQKRLWTLSRIEGSSAAFNIPMAIRLEGDLNVEALKDSVHAIVDRHEALRTVIRENDQQQPIGVLLSDYQNVWTVVDEQARYATLDEQGKTAFVNACVLTKCGEPFDLSVDLPIRVALVRLSPRSFLFVLTLQHHAGDGISGS